MLEVRIKNNLLNPTIQFLYDLSLKGKQSRHRSKFIKLLNERTEEVVEQQDELLKQHCNLDEDGNPKKINNGKEYDVKDIAAFAEDRTELYNEEMVIDGQDAQIMLRTVRGVLDDLDVELSGQDAVLYDHLCEQFKVDEDIDGEDDADVDE